LQRSKTSISTSFAEGREKIAKGMEVLICEGTVSKDIEALAGLITPFASLFFGLYTDDRKPARHRPTRAHGFPGPAGDPARGAGDVRISRGKLAGGTGLRVARSWLVAPGYLADLLLPDDLETCAVATVTRRGRVVTGESFATRALPAPPTDN